MAEFYDKSTLMGHVGAMFERMARTHPNPALQGPERPLEAAIIHEYSNLGEATADGPQLPQDRVKPRVVVLSTAVDTSGRAVLFVHKGRQNRDKSVQIGRTWKLEELVNLDSVPTSVRILVLGFRKPYYWVFTTPEQLQEFEAALRYYYKELTGNLLSESAPPPVPTVSRKRTVSSPRPPNIGTPQISSSPSPQHTPALAPVAPLRRGQSQFSHESSVESLPSRSPLRSNSIPPLSKQPSARSLRSQKSQRTFPVPPTEDSEQQLKPPFVEPEVPPPSVHRREQRYREESARQAEAARQAELASQERARQRQSMQEQAMRTQAAQELARSEHAKQAEVMQEQASQEQLWQERAMQEQAMQEQAMQEQARQEKLRQEQAMQEEFRQEQTRQEQARQEQARQEQARQEQARQEQARQEQARQKQARQEQARQEKARQEQARQEQARQEQAREEQVTQEHFRQVPARQDQSRAKQLSINTDSAFSASSQDQPNQREDTKSGKLQIRPQHLNKLAQEQIQQWEQPKTPVDPHPAHSFASPGPMSPEPELRALSRLRGRNSNAHGGTMQPTREETMIHDVMVLFDEFKWSGKNVSALERQIKDRLDELADHTFANVVDLDSQLDEIDELVSQSIKECDAVDEKMQAVAMNLAGVGDEIAHIQGQGDGLQITAVNYQRLASEIESLLATVTLPQSVVQTIRAPDFGQPGTNEGISKLARVEDLLLELYRAVKVSSLENESGVGLGSMRVLKERGHIIGETANEFSTKFSRFVLKSVENLCRSVPSLDSSFERSLEIQLISQLYAYCGCTLFLKESSSRMYRALNKEYQRLMRSYYERQFTSYSATWVKQLDQIIGKRSSIKLHASETSGVNAGQRKSKTGDDLQGSGDILASSSNVKTTMSLSSERLQQLYRHMSMFVDQLCFHVSAQQRFLVKFFVLGDEGTQQFDSFVVQQQPLPKARLREQQRLESKVLSIELQGIDTSESASYAVLAVLRDRIFVKLGELMSEAVKSLTNVAIFESVYMATVIDLRMHILRKSSQQYLTSLLERLLKTIFDAWDNVSKQQTRSILSAQYTTKKRVGVLPVVAHFTEHISIVEQSTTAALLNEREIGHMKTEYEADATREMVDKSHETLFRAIAQGLQLGSTPTAAGHQTTAARLKAAARETAGSAVTGEEAKELLNRHVVMIENMNRLVSDLERFGSIGVQRIVLNAKQHYKKELDSYINDVIMRPFGRVMSLLHHYDSQHGQSSKEIVSNIKRSLNGLDGKELRKGTETLRKRVEKHFAGADPVLQERVWHAIGDQYMAYYQRVQRIAQQYDATNYIEFSSADITNAFR